MSGELGDPKDVRIERGRIASIASTGSVAAGELIGPRIYTTGPLLTVPDGHPIARVTPPSPPFPTPATR